MISLIQEIPQIPEVVGPNVTPIYVWIITILVIALAGIIGLYERKLSAVTTRLNTVIDDSISRMERKSDNEQSGLTRINDMLVQLKEIVVLANR